MEDKEASMKKWAKAFCEGAIAFGIIFSWTLAEQKSLWRGTISKEGEITIVKNPKEPLHKDNIISLKEELAIGGAEAQGNFALAVVRSLAVDDAENIYVLDEKDIQIKVFDKNGNFIRMFGQRGQGPGDLNNPSRVVIDKFKNALMVKNGPLGLSFFGLDGKFLQTITNNDTRQTQWAEVDSHGNIFMSMVDVLDMEHRRQVLKKSDPKMTSISEIKSVTLSSAYELMAPFAFWTLDCKDSVIFGFPKEYEIEIIGAHNKTVKKIVKEYIPVEVSPEEKARYTQRLKEVRLSPDMMSKMFVSKYYSAYANFLTDDNGWLFVANWERAGKDYVYDVFDPEGRYMAKFTPPYKSILFKKGKLYTSEETEEGYQVIKRYRVNWIIKAESQQ